MKLLKKYFLTKIDKIQIRQINGRYSIRLSSKLDMNYNYRASCRLSPLNNKAYKHYFFYLSNSLFPKVKNAINKVESIKVYISSPAEIIQSKGRLFKYNVSELYLDNGKIISL